MVVVAILVVADNDSGLFIAVSKDLVVDALAEGDVVVELTMLRPIEKFPGPGVRVHGKTLVTVPSSSVSVDVDAVFAVDVAVDAVEDVSNGVVRKDGRERIVEPEDPVVAEDGFVPVVAEDVFVVVEDEFVPVVDCALMAMEADPGVLPLAPKQYIVRVVDCVT